MKRIKNLLLFIALWSIAYYFGQVEYAAFDDVWNYKDFLAIGGGLGGMVYAFRAVHNV